MRALVRLHIVNNLEGSGSEIPAERWHGSGSIVDTPPRPFAELRFGGRYPGMGQVRRRRLEVWIHDDEGDYDRIEKELKFVKGLLDGAHHIQDGAGNEIVACTWVNDSTDLYDDGYRTNCMMSNYDLVGKEAP